jgi:hypothetical protein
MRLQQRGELDCPPPPALETRGNVKTTVPKRRFPVDLTRRPPSSSLRLAMPEVESEPNGERAAAAPDVATPTTGDPQLDAKTRKKLWELGNIVIAASAQILKGGKYQRDVAYWTQYWMNVALFVVGLVAFVAALVSGFGASNQVATVTFGGLSAATFVAIFISQPLHALQRNSTYSAWLSLIINTYWTQLLEQTDPKTAIPDLERISAAATEQIEKLARAQGRSPVTAPGEGASARSGAPDGGRS